MNPANPSLGGSIGGNVTSRSPWVVASAESRQKVSGPFWTAASKIWPKVWINTVACNRALGVKKKAMGWPGDHDDSGTSFFEPNLGLLFAQKIQTRPFFSTRSPNLFGRWRWWSSNPQIRICTPTRTFAYMRGGIVSGWWFQMFSVYHRNRTDHPQWRADFSHFAQRISAVEWTEAVAREAEMIPFSKRCLLIEVLFIDWDHHFLTWNL